MFLLLIFLFSFILFHFAEKHVLLSLGSRFDIRFGVYSLKLMYLVSRRAFFCGVVLSAYFVFVPCGFSKCRFLSFLFFGFLFVQYVVTIPFSEWFSYMRQPQN